MCCRRLWPSSFINTRPIVNTLGSVVGKLWRPNGIPSARSLQFPKKSYFFEKSDFWVEYW